MNRSLLVLGSVLLAQGCTVVDLWDAPEVEVEVRSCRVDADCATVRFEVDETLRNDPCLVALRSCDTGREQCTVQLRARDSDRDNFRDIACASVRSEFPPFDVDCDDANPNAYPNADLDSDGFVARGCGDGLPEDCDDTRATAFPGATVEACDGVVSACTDATPPLRRLVEDFDGDRFAAIALDPSVCVDVMSPNGELLSIPHTDCDDIDPNVFPAAPDVCDGRHNDCDSPIGVGRDAGEDVDGDGFAAPSSLSCDPELPGGLPNTDCDDLDAKTYPGAEESCDGIVNNCTDRTPGEVDRLIEDPDEDGHYGGNADCIDPVVNIECSNAAFDRFSTFCLPSPETTVVSSIMGVTRMVAADFDANGFEEVAYVRDDVGCPTEQRIVVNHSFSNSSSALFSQTNVCDAVGATVRVFAADVDGDAPLELMTLSSTGAVQSYELTTSSLNLTLKTAMGITVTGGALALGRLDGVAAPVAVALEGSALVYHPLDATGSAGAAVSIDATSPSFTGLVLGDVTNDGVVDVVGYASSSAMITVYPGSGGGAFAAELSIDVGTLLPGIGNPTSVVLGDVEGSGDGDLDLVVAGSSGLGVLARRGSAFEGVSVGVQPNGESLALGELVADDIAVRDLGRNGSDEIVYSTTDRDSVGYIDEIGSGLFAQHVFVADLDAVTWVAAGDWDGDFDVDIAAYASGSSSLMRYTSDFVSTLQFGGRVVDRAFDAGAAVAFDVDADGAMDIIGASDLPGGEVVLWRARSRDFARIEEIVVTNADAGEVVSGLAAGDVTGDARADFVLVSETNGLVGYVRGVGDLTYAARQALTPFDNARAVVMEDFDGDGLDEVLVTANDGTDGRAALYTREGTGNTFTRTILDATSSACTGIALGDVDGDGDQDAALACGTDGVVLLTNPGQPEGTWTVTTVYDGAGGANASSVEITDVDRDGTGDIVSYRADLESVRIDQAGDGSFGAAPILVPADVASPSGALVRAIDADADGDPDLVVAGLDTGASISVLQHIGSSDPRFVLRVILTGSTGRATALTPLDVGGDRFADFMVTLPGQRIVAAFRSSPNPWWNH
ncbi:MAG: VCBS repeat-containing protein [Sandaracinaceae bacterium]|jgi:hypothetical protein|nr:VCBS repeat-containing protein [Sandaracinaceae bacterium]